MFPEDVAARDARELTPSPALALLRTASIAWVRALAADLQKQGIRYAIDRKQARNQGLLALMVRRQDLHAAEAVDEAREQIEGPSERDLDEFDDFEGSDGEAASSATYKVCPRCGGEYRLDIERCADCEVALVFPGDEPEPEELIDLEPPAEFLFTGPLRVASGDDLVCICCRPVSALQALSFALNDAGIAHRLDPVLGRKARAGCLYVLEADGDAAAALDVELSSVPLGDVSTLPADLAGCPACDTPRSFGATECRGCGLVLGPGAGVDRTCSYCGAVIALETPRCPNCDEPLSRS